MRSTKLGIGGTFIHSNEQISISFLLTFIKEASAFEEKKKKYQVVTHVSDWPYILGLFPPNQAVCSNAWSMQADSETQMPGWSGTASQRRWAKNWALKTHAILRVGADLESVFTGGRRNWKTSLCWVLENKCSPFMHLVFSLTSQWY